MTQKLNLTILLIGLTTQLSFSQYLDRSVLGTTGLYQSVSGFSVSYTVGEVAVTTETGGNYFLTQGFQQVYEKLAILPDSVSVFPNPVKDVLVIQLFRNGFSNYRVEFFDIKGRLTWTGNIRGVAYGEKTIIDVSDFPNQLYIVRIYSDDGKLFRLLKIVKI